mmetsp:Transcript_36164/g.115825  ORF Transcript_36164/g.115825 Transcript_36164/m.115825 type:complete len:112 (-) Transcript_36164:543-878(-)
MRSACEPCSATVPRSRTTMLWALSAMEKRRWAMMRVVFFVPKAASRASWSSSLTTWARRRAMISASVSGSRELVASSKRTTGASLRKARARATRCFSPPLSLRPRSPTRVS